MGYLKIDYVGWAGLCFVPNHVRCAFRAERARPMQGPLVRVGVDQNFKRPPKHSLNSRSWLDRTLVPKPFRVFSKKKLWSESRPLLTISWFVSDRADMSWLKPTQLSVIFRWLPITNMDTTPSHLLNITFKLSCVYHYGIMGPFMTK